MTVSKRSSRLLLSGCVVVLHSLLQSRDTLTDVSLIYENRNVHEQLQRRTVVQAVTNWTRHSAGPLLAAPPPLHPSPL